MGVVIGTGILVVTGTVAEDYAGPAVAPLAFVVSAAVCGLAALCCAEFASTVPVAGSARTFSYASRGVVLLRRSRPRLPRTFRTPWGPALPLLSVLASRWLMLGLGVETWLRFVETWLRFAFWTALGLVMRGLYGRRHSRLRRTAT